MLVTHELSLAHPHVTSKHEPGPRNASWCTFFVVVTDYVLLQVVSKSVQFDRVLYVDEDEVRDIGIQPTVASLYLQRWVTYKR